MSCYHYQRISFASLALIVLIGCGTSDFSGFDESIGHEKSISVAPQEQPELHVPVAFKPPNPSRTNPFAMSDEQVANDDSTTQGNQGTGPRVVVYGFANVGGQRAILVVDGRRCSLGILEKHNGVQVTKIEPPNVTLQSGNFIWTASMFDQTH